MELARFQGNCNQPSPAIYLKINMNNCIKCKKKPVIGKKGICNSCDLKIYNSKSKEQRMEELNKILGFFNKNLKR